jgi:hypothetical protein
MGKDGEGSATSSSPVQNSGLGMDCSADTLVVFLVPDLLGRSSQQLHRVP